MLKQLMVLGLCLVLSGCAKSPDEIQMPTTDAEMKEVQEYIVKNLEGEDRDLATEVLMKYAIGSAFGAVPKENMTLADAMAEQKEANRLEKEKIEKRQATIKKMKDAIEVVYINHKPIHKEYLGLVGYNLRIKFRNKQDKPISGVKGKLMFTDSFGEKSGEIDVEYMGTLNKNDNVYEQIQSITTHGRSYLEDLEYQSEDVRFEPEVIVFNDKSSLSIVD